MDNQEQERTIHLTDYYHILLKHKWLLAAALVLVTALTGYTTFRMMPVYQATCVMVIEKERSTSPLTGERLEYESYYTQSIRFSTHAKLLTSRPVILRVIKQLKLDQTQTENSLEISPIKAYIANLKQNIRKLFGQPRKEPSPRELQDLLVNGIKSTIYVEAVEDTHLLNINTYSHDPDLAKNVANTLAKSYIEFNLENRMSSSQNTLSWMSNQLFETKKKLEEAEENFLAYKQAEKLFSLEEKQDGITSKIDNLNNTYMQTRNQRVEIESKLKEIENMAGSPHVRTLINNAMIDSLYSQILESEIELSRLSKVYKSKHPKIVQVKTAIENAGEKFRTEIRKEEKNLATELSILRQKEIELKKTIENFESDALSTNRKELKYTIFKRNVDTHQRLYDILLQRVKESNITRDIDVSNIRIAEAAITPLSPIRPNKTRRMVLGIFFGLMIGVGLAFLREYLDKTLRTEEDIQSYLNLPVLAIVPEAEKGNYQPPKNPAAAKEPPGRVNQKSQVKSARIKKLQHVFLDTYVTNSSFAEAYRTLRTNIQFSSLDKRLRSFVLTSAIAKEGKTLTAANTAYALAQTGKSVLMIDIDLRKPTLSSLVPAAETPGFTGLLSGLFGTEVRSGSLSELQIGDLFRLLTMQKKSGVLSLSRENEKIELLFYSGKLVDLNWITRPEDEKLASVLISNGMISEGQARQAFARQKAAGQKLGFVLLNLGFLKKEELTGPLTVHLMEGLRKALGFNSGSFSFKDRSESDFEPSAFDPVDFNRMYKQLIIGEEPIAYLKQKINEAVIKTHIKNLYILPSGDIPPNPSELLTSDRMSFLLSTLQKRFDYLVIDAPPIVPASDALLIAPHVDGVLLVVKSGCANRDLVIKTVEKLRMTQTGILGVAFNHVNIKKAGYYKYYFKNYARYYADRA